jgi:hypothetical protein
LDHYIVEKNKLHNRYLHGWGVVCGLEVVCSPCNAVTVRGGYALSPCGEDIIVCKEVTVDVCSLINQCKDKRRDWECEPFGVGQHGECLDADEDWILTVRYDEKSSRGITALKGGSAPACCTSCNCGGSSSGSSGGCGCGGGNGNGKSAHASVAVGSPSKSYRPSSATATIAAQCEPTITCEGYVFEVCKPAPEQTAAQTIRNALGKGGPSKGAIVDRAEACFLNFLSIFPKRPEGANVTKAQLYQWCCAMKKALRDNLIAHPVYNCEVATALNFACPDPNTNMPFDVYNATVQTILQDVMAVVAGEYIRYCLCSAFLPPCPEVVCDPRVPLATIKVRKDQNGNCRIVRVCNLGERRFVITFANLGYWFSFVLFPLRKKFRQFLEKICCSPWNLGRQVNPNSVNPTFNRADAETTGSTEQPASSVAAPSVVVGGGGGGVRPVTTKRGFKAFAGQVWANRGRSVTEETLFLGAIGAKDQSGQPELADTELANPFFTLLVNRLAGPQLARLPDDSPNIAKRSGMALLGAGLDPRTHAAATVEKTGPPDDDIETLKTRVSELQSAVEQQSRMIEELRKQVKPE